MDDLFDDPKKVLGFARLADLGLITTSLAHEMRQPLLGLKAYAQLIRENPEEAASHAGEILQQAIVLETLLDRVRAYARGTPGPVARPRADLGSTFEAAQGLLRGLARTAFVRIESAIPKDLPPVAIDETSLQQILVNLLRNAIECPRREPPGHVWTTASLGQGRIEVIVQDDGPGITPEVRATLFEALRTTKADGMGLGLHLSRRIVEQQGGTLEEDPTVEKGARFRVILPVDA